MDILATHSTTLKQGFIGPAQVARSQIFCGAST